MLSRVVWNLLTAASVATLLGVGWFFWREFERLDAQDRHVAELKKLAEREGACAALLDATRRRQEPESGFETRRALDLLRDELAGEILAAPKDRKGQRALVNASDSGL